MLKLVIANQWLIQHFCENCVLNTGFGVSYSFRVKMFFEVFDSYLNTCPHQGSRTIRTEVVLFDWPVVYVPIYETCDLNKICIFLTGSNFHITSVFPRTNQPSNAKSSTLKLPEVSQV
jgi:hypothetical protein